MQEADLGKWGEYQGICRSAPQERSCNLEDVYLEIMRGRKNKIIEQFKVDEICQEVYVK